MKKTGIEHILSVALLFWGLLYMILAFGCPCGMAADSCDSAWLLMNKGIALSDDSDQEAMYYQEAAALCPDLFEDRVRLGRVYKNQGKLDQAATVLRDTITAILSSDFFMTRPGSKQILIDAMLSLGEVYRLQGRLDLAEQQYSKVLVMFPDSTVAQNQMEYVYKRLHKFDAVPAPRYNLLTNPTFTRISGFCLPKGKFLIDTQYRFWIQDAPLSPDQFETDLPLIPPEERTADIHMWAAGVRYGITDKFSVGVVAKYFSRKVQLKSQLFWGMGSDIVNLRVSGFGDTVIMLKYHLWGMRKRHLSIYNLLSIPTGNDDATDSDGFIKRKIPLGSGSFDNTPGIAFTADFDPLITNINVSYRITNGENVGDEFNMGLALSYPYKHTVFASLELGYRWRDDVRIKQYVQSYIYRPDMRGGMVSEQAWMTEKGGSTFFIEPGVQLMVGRGVKFEVGVKVPVIKPDKGWIEDFVLLAGISKAFF